MERKTLASRREVAAYLQVPVATLERWATRSEGPPYRKVGRHTRYVWSEVDAWLTAQHRGPRTA